MKETKAPTNLLCEYAENPLGIDVTAPRFSWLLNHTERGQLQSAYQVLVATSRDNLDTNKADKWDSAKLASGESINIAYEGTDLESGKTYYWKVRIWDKNGRVSQDSEIATFEMGLLKLEDWQGDWIGLPAARAGEALLFRKEFILDREVSRARAYISGLGYYELRINGTKVGDHVLDPGWTEYTKRTLYAAYDVTEYLTQGENVVGVMAGSGWYGSPQIILQLNIIFADGTTSSVFSGTHYGPHAWRVAGSPITKNSIYDGETYDARLEKEGWDSPHYPDYLRSTHDWVMARRLESPGGVMKSQMMEPIKVVQTIKPLSITNPKPAVYIYDMGQNMSGWGRLTVKGKRGTRVAMRFAEVLSDDGILDQGSVRAARATDTYILKGEGEETYEPRFTYHGFRYVEVTGFPGTAKLENLKGRVVRSAVEPIGKFTSSDELLNKIHQSIVWTEGNNLHSVPTDCPQRDERLGWLNDVTISFEEALHNFNMVRFYTKWMQDIRDTQDKVTGSITDTAPYRRGDRPADPVCQAYLLIPWGLYQHYADKRILEEYYEGLKQWVDFLGTRTDDYIMTYCKWGDWHPPTKECWPPDNPEVPPDSPGAVTVFGGFPANTPGILTSTAYYYYAVSILSAIANVLGKSKDADEYSHLADSIKKAFNRRFFDKVLAQYATGSQGSNAFPLFLNLVPENKKKAVLENLVKDIIKTHNAHITTGFHCTKYLIETLVDNGLEDIAYAVLSQTTYPSLGYMVKKGSTTIWECWEYTSGLVMNSYNHPALGSVDTFFYKALGGIRIDSEAPGWRRIVIKPYIAGNLTYAHASLKTIRGIVSSRWEKQGNSLTLNVVIPVNSEARVSVPKIGLGEVTVTESGKTIWQDSAFMSGVAGITSGKESSTHITFAVGSGSYSFELGESGFNSK